MQAKLSVKELANLRSSRVIESNISKEKDSAAMLGQDASDVLASPIPVSASGES